MNNFESCPPSKRADNTATASQTTNPKPPQREAWNKGVAVGKKIGLTRRQTKKIYRHLKRRSRKEKDGLRNLAIFVLATDTMLRVSDLMSLRISQLFYSNGQIRKTISVKQGKSKRNVTCVLTRKAIRIVERWKKELDERQDQETKNDYLFPGVGTTSHFSTRQCRRLVKQWVEAIGLPHENYSTHSMRRTKSNIVFRKTRKDWNIVRLLLGQASILSTQQYIEVEDKKALLIAQKIALF